jgi:hypothetical protein
MMNSFNNRQGVFLISAIMAMVATAFIFFVPISITFLVAYFFTMLAITMFFFGSLYMLSNPKSYPWLIAFPRTIWRYLMFQLILSAGFVIRDVIFPDFIVRFFPVGLFIFLHILLLGIFTVKLILIKGGKEIIEAKDEEISEKVSVIRLMHADVESILRKHPNYEKPLKQVIEALKYSDPMSHPTVTYLEEDIQKSIASMTGLEGNESANIPKICEQLLRQIMDRNNRLKLMK